MIDFEDQQGNVMWEKKKGGEPCRDREQTPNTTAFGGDGDGHCHSKDYRSRSPS